MSCPENAPSQASELPRERTRSSDQTIATPLLLHLNCRHDSSRGSRVEADRQRAAQEAERREAARRRDVAKRAKAYSEKCYREEVREWETYERCAEKTIWKEDKYNKKRETHLQRRERLTRVSGTRLAFEWPLQHT